MMRKSCAIGMRNAILRNYLNYQICLKIQDNNMNAVTALQSKDYVKFLGVLIDKHLTWKQHINYIACKISKIVGLIARLRHHVPLNTFIGVSPRFLY